MTSRERRLMVVATSLVACAFFLRMTPGLLRRWHRTSSEFDQQASLFARLRDEVRSVEATSNRADSVRRHFIALDTAILAGQTEAEASASLSAQLNLAADRAGALLQQAVPVTDSTAAGALHRVTAHATFAGDTRGIARILQSLAEDPVAMGVRTIRLVAPDPGSPDGVAEMLSLELDVSGWYQERRP
ncbi:MAG TPA: GspMb/PilO family protein [Gemmatimonadales bacterium]|nr:GspMb/PilO family protein [Gemmatimonadales bacterium]